MDDRRGFTRNLAAEQAFTLVVELVLQLVSILLQSLPMTMTDRVKILQRHGEDFER